MRDTPIFFRLPVVSVIKNKGSMMYKILNRIAAIVLLGSISIPISAMEGQRALENGQEKRAADPVAPLADDAAKRQRFAQELQARVATAVSNSPERQTIKMEREDDTEVPMQPVISNAQILEMLTGLGTLFDARMSYFQGIMEGKFAENDMKLGALTRAVEEMKRSSLQPGLMPPPAAKAPARARPKQESAARHQSRNQMMLEAQQVIREQANASGLIAALDKVPLHLLPAAISGLSSETLVSPPGRVSMLPAQMLQAEHSVGEQARPLNAALGMLSNGTTAPQQAASPKLPPQLLQAGQAPQSAQPGIPPQNPAATQEGACTYTQTKDFLAHAGPINYLIQLGDSMFSSSSNDCFKRSDRDGACQETMKFSGAGVGHVAAYKTSMGVLVCLAFQDNTIMVKFEDGKSKKYEGHTARVNCIIPWDPSWDGGYGKRQVLSASADTTIKLWDLENGSLIRTISGHGGSVNAIRVATLWCIPCLVSGSADMSIKIWNRDGKLLKTIQGHEGSVTCLDSIDTGFSRTIIVSGSADGTVRFWDQEGQNLNTILHGDAVHSVKRCWCGPGGMLIVTASQSKIKLWLVKLNMQGHPESVRHLHTINANNDAVLQNNLSDDMAKISAIDLVGTSRSGEFILTYGTHGGRIKKGVIKISGS